VIGSVFLALRETPHSPLIKEAQQSPNLIYTREGNHKTPSTYYRLAPTREEHNQHMQRVESYALPSFKHTLTSKGILKMEMLAACGLTW
jgi:hypothetical protein